VALTVIADGHDAERVAVAGHGAVADHEDDCVHDDVNVRDRCRSR
jgi:hypothetical protein